MKTFTIKNDDGEQSTFEINNTSVGPWLAAQILKSNENVTQVELIPYFWFSQPEGDIFEGERVSFRYKGVLYMVWEPFGDNSRYWIVPRDAEFSLSDISELEQTFKNYNPSLIEQIKDLWCGDKSRLFIIILIILFPVLTIVDYLN